MRRTVEGWLTDATEILQEGFDHEIEELAGQALTAVRQVLEAHHRVGSPAHGKVHYCASCEDRWPCDTVRRIAKALEVRA